MNIRLKSIFLSFLVSIGFIVTMPAFVQAQTSPSLPTATFENTILTLVNSDRTAQGVSALTENSLLAAAAQAKANDMATEGYFAHYSPSGTSPWYWFTLVGYYYTHAGENLAINFDDPTAVETAWMASPSHRANIVRGLYTQTGIGIAHGTYLGKPATFIVQLFATPALPLVKVNKPSTIAMKTF